MAYPERRELISQLERVRGSKVLCYFLSDRETFPPGIVGFATNLGTEPLIHLIDQIRTIGKTQKIDLFLYTRGGATDSVWPLVSLLREHCDKLSVIVPWRAHSGGTLICLGADEVVMTGVAELSPIDPTTGNQFNPGDPTNPQNKFGISVEDVAAYFELSKARAGIKQESYMAEVFKELTSKVHPLALGNVQRVYLQIRKLASSLLSLHMDEEKEKKNIDRIVTTLTEKFYSHVHSISRKEAVSLLGDWVRKPNEEEESVIWNLFNSYADALKLREKYNLPKEIGDAPQFDLKVVGGFIESSAMSHVFVTDLKVIQRPDIPPNIQVQVPPGGGALPFPPWATRSFSFGILSVGWRGNDGTI